MESHPCSVNQIDIWAIWVIIVTLPRRRLGHCWLHTQSLCGSLGEMQRYLTFREEAVRTIPRVPAIHKLPNVQRVHVFV